MPVRSLLGKRNRESQKVFDLESRALTLKDTITNHPEPALLVDARAHVVVANDTGSAFAAALETSSLPDVVMRIAEVCETGRSVVAKAFGPSMSHSCRTATCRQRMSPSLHMMSPAIAT